MKNHNKKGFTIVELIIVIAVIGVLAAILIPTFSGVIEKANAKSALSDAKNALTAYMADMHDNAEEAAITTLGDSMFAVHKAGKLWFFEYTQQKGSLVQVGEAKDCAIDINDPDYATSFTSTASGIVASMIEDGYFLGSTSVTMDINSTSGNLNNVMAFLGTYNAGGSDYYANLVPKAQLLANETTVVDSAGNTVPAIAVSTPIELYSVFAYMVANSNGAIMPSLAPVRSIANIDCTTNIKLTADLFMGGVNFIAAGTEANPYCGVFDGNGHTVYDLHTVRNAPIAYAVNDISSNPITQYTQSTCSLFNYTGANASGDLCVIKNITFNNVYCNSAEVVSVAPVAQYAKNSLIENIVVNGTVRGQDCVSGIATSGHTVIVRGCTINADIISECTGTPGSGSDNVTVSGVLGSSCHVFFDNCAINGALYSYITGSNYSVMGLLSAQGVVGYPVIYGRIRVGENAKIYGHNTDTTYFTGTEYAGGEERAVTRRICKAAGQIDTYLALLASNNVGTNRLSAEYADILAETVTTSLFGGRMDERVFCIDAEFNY